MRTLFIALAMFAGIGTAQAQSSDTTTVGKIAYYEGKVEIGNEAKWSAVRINAPVKKNQFIRTIGDGMAEVTWKNGTKSVIGPNSKITVLALMSGTNSKAKTSTESVFTGFKTMFNEGPGKKRSEEGGVRRDEAKVADNSKEEIYWKEDKEIMFSEAYAFYENKEYSKAIAALEAFISQKPKDEMAKFARFALGHSYIMCNNTVKAKEIYEQFVFMYPEDPLNGEAKKVLAEL